MIQLDEKSDKAALADPPAYSSNETTLYPPQQSPVSTGLPPPSSASSSHAPAQPTPAYPPSPASRAPLNPQMQQAPPAPQPQMTPAQLEAQIGSNYQQQCAFSPCLPLCHDGKLRYWTVFAQCARGNHDATRKYGACGIIAAILLFPIGLICLLYVLPPLPVHPYSLLRSSDSEERCTRCGVLIEPKH